MTIETFDQAEKRFTTFRRRECGCIQPILERHTREESPERHDRMKKGCRLTRTLAKIWPFIKSIALGKEAYGLPEKERIPTDKFYQVMTRKKGDNDNKKILVAYFSGQQAQLKKAAQALAEAAHADIYEIKPEVPYTKDDLNWTDRKSRSSVEMSDQTYRPAIADQSAEIENYDLIFLGYPVWWYV